MADCIFCKIAAHQIPSNIVFENDAVVAFLDVSPLAEGHTLVIPRNHVDRMENMSEDDVAALARALPRLARAVRDVTGAAGLNILQNNGRESGQAVWHVHVHLIPRTSGDGLGYRWNTGQYPAGRAEQVRDALVAAVGT